MKSSMISLSHGLSRRLRHWRGSPSSPLREVQGRSPAAPRRAIYEDKHLPIRKSHLNQEVKPTPIIWAKSAVIRPMNFHTHYVKRDKY